ncbi:MAG: ribonuclease III [Bacilli bacterium]
MKNGFDIMDFLERFNIKINDKEIFQTALTHSSYSNEHKGVLNYERLEYLGDAVLELVTSEYFYLNTKFKEGQMTKMRASYVCEKALATYAKEIGIDKHIRLGHGQMNNLNDTIIADVFEAVVGAIYLDQGFEVVKKYIDAIIIPYIDKKIDFNIDYKTKLQELVQTDKKSVTYEVINEYEKNHKKVFEVVVKVDEIIFGRGKGNSKKEAEQLAALDAYNKSCR